MVLPALLSLMAATSCFAGGMSDSPGELVEFQMPSANVGCIYVPAGGTATYSTADGGAELQCDRIAPGYARVILRESGKAKRINNVGDASCCSGETLSYGESWHEGPFTCLSAKTGLTCTRGKHGFVISRKSIKTY